MNAPQLRIARPVGDLERAVCMYRAGLGLVELGRFADHAGFDGVMLGRAGWTVHFEFTFCRHHPVAPAPTPEDLVVVYLPDAAVWEDGCRAMREAGFAEVEPFNPWWGQRGRTFADPDGYRTVLERADWPAR